MTDILIIEDNLDIAAILCDFLKKDGYTYHHATTGEEGLSYIHDHNVRLVLLDIMLPGIDGFYVCKEIYQNQNIPIIISSAKTEKDDQLNGLNLGADAYIEKPYDIDLLLAKIKVLYRRHYQENKGTHIQEGDFKIDTSSRTAFYKENSLTLTVKEYDLLLLFMQNKEKALHKSYIFDMVWGIDSFSEPSTLTVHVKWLREKIEANPKEPVHIQTIWGVGYRFIP